MTEHPRHIGPPLPPDWHERLALRALAEIHAIATKARRSLGQKIRYARADVRRIANDWLAGARSMPKQQKDDQ